MLLLMIWWQKSLPKVEVRKHKSRHHNTLINIPTCIARVFWKQYCETAYVGCNTRKSVNIWILTLNKTCKCKLSNSYSVFVMSCVCVDHYRLLFSHESVSIFNAPKKTSGMRQGCFKIPILFLMEFLD